MLDPELMDILKKLPPDALSSCANFRLALAEVMYGLALSMCPALAQGLETCDTITTVVGEVPCSQALKVAAQGVVLELMSADPLDSVINAVCSLAAKLPPGVLPALQNVAGLYQALIDFDLGEAAAEALALMDSVGTIVSASANYLVAAAAQAWVFASSLFGEALGFGVLPDTPVVAAVRQLGTKAVQMLIDVASLAIKGGWETAKAGLELVNALLSGDLSKVGDALLDFAGKVVSLGEAALKAISDFFDLF